MKNEHRNILMVSGILLSCIAPLALIGVFSFATGFLSKPKTV